MTLALNDAPQAIHLNATLVTMIVAVVGPLVVGAVTKSTNKYKGFLLALVVGVIAAVTKAVVPDGGAVWTAQTAVNAVLGIVTAEIAYAKVFLKIGLTNDPAASADKGNGKALLGTKGL